MKTRHAFKTPPFDVIFWADANEASLVARSHPAIQFEHSSQGANIAHLASKHSTAIEFAADIKKNHQLDGWIISTAYRDAQISQHDAQTRAEVEFSRQQHDSPHLAFSRARATSTLRNPMTWAFTTEVHSLLEPKLTWRRHIEIDKITGEPWNTDTYAEYRHISPFHP